MTMMVTKDWTQDAKGWNDGAAEAMLMQARFEHTIMNGSNVSLDNGYENELMKVSNDHLKQEITFMTNLQNNKMIASF